MFYRDSSLFWVVNTEFDQALSVGILNKLGNLFVTRTFLISNFCHHGSGGAAVDYPPSQQDPYLSHHKYFKLITCSVEELCFFFFLSFVDKL
jgi:hypothetical protein